MYRRLDLNRRCGRMAGLHDLQNNKNNYITITTLKKMSSIIPSRRKFIGNIRQKEIR
jgi:hypothetical protein